MIQEKLTQKSEELIQNAQNLAGKCSNQFVTPEHLLEVMLRDKEGLAASLINQAGSDPERVKQVLHEDLEKLPKVEGNCLSVSASQNFLKVLLLHLL